MNAVRFHDAAATHAPAERLYQHIRPIIAQALAQAGIIPAAAHIEHIGATAVPGLLTKGDLDINIRVPDADFARADAAMSTLFNRNTGSDRSPTFSAFADDSTQPPLGIQLTAIGGPEDSFCTLRDALRADATLAAGYAALKRSFDGRDHDEYRAAKAVWIERVLSATPRC